MVFLDKLVPLKTCLNCIRNDDIIKVLWIIILLNEKGRHMSEKVINAGDEVDSYCTSCKLILAHRVVALVDDKPDKVLCMTCNRKHKYRPNLPKSRTKKADGDTGTKKKATRTRRKDPALIWEEALAEKGSVEAKAYAMNGDFLQGDIIEHVKFGRGLVKEIQAEGKMDVLFKEGPKLLVYGRGTDS